MEASKRQNGSDESNSGPKEPRVLRVTPDGRTIMDPMSVIESDSFVRHLNEIKDIPTQDP